MPKNLKRGGPAALLAVMVLLFLVATGRARAFEALSGDTVVIQADQVVADDLYVAADEFVLEGTVQGDLVVAARLITVEGRVDGDLIAAGQVIRLDGTVTDDARLAAAVLILGEAATLTDDLFGAAYSLEALPGSTIGGALAYAGAQALLAGLVEEDALFSASAVELRGEVQGNVEADVASSGGAAPFGPFFFMPDAPAVPSVAPGLTVNPDAQIGGDLNYSGDEGAIAAGTVAGQVTRAPVAGATVEPEDPAGGLLTWLADQARRLIVLLLVGLLVLWLAPNVARGAAAALRERPLPSLGWGLLTLVAVPLAVLLIGIAVVILALLLNLVTLDALAGVITVVGLWLVLTLVLALIVAVAYLAQVIVSFLIGRWLLGRVNAPAAQGRLWPLVIGVVVVVVLTAIPIVGWLVTAAVVLFGLGALVVALVRRREFMGRPVVVAEPV